MNVTNIILKVRSFGKHLVYFWQNASNSYYHGEPNLNQSCLRASDLPSLSISATKNGTTTKKLFGQGACIENLFFLSEISADLPETPLWSEISASKAIF